MPDDKRPSTPPANKDSLLVQDTPLSQGSGSHSSFRTENRQTQYKPYLIEDLKSQFFITLDDFFTHILKIQSSDLKQKPLKVADQKRIDDAFDRYGALGKKDSESSRYYPFITLANLIISSLTGTDWPTFCRNDPIIIQGSSAERKPDVVLLPPGAVDGTKRGLADELLKGPEKMPFYWSEVLAYLEFKLGEPRMESYEIQELAMPSELPSKQHLTVPEPLPSASTPTGKGKSVADVRRSSRISSTSQKRPGSDEDRNDSSRNSKRQRTDDDGNVIHKDWVQCASYALELLSHGGLRNHVLGAMVSGHSLQLLYYDRSIILASQPFNFMQDKDRLFTLLTALSKFTTREWGYAYPPLKPACLLSSPPDRDSVFEGLSLQLGNGRKLLLKGTLFHQHGLIGRGTCVVRAICLPAGSGDHAEEGDDARGNDLWRGNLVVKLSWPSATRLSEPDTINAAREHAIRHGDAWVLNHLPEVLYSEDIDWSLLSPELIKQLGDKYEKRVLRIMVLEELSPITDRTTAPELAQSFREIFRCYRWLVEKAGLLHRDISLGNLMCREKDGIIYGVLADFDLAVYTIRAGPSSKQRTGTRPFMAIDLLEKDPPQHMYCHDLESIAYVFFWIILRYDNGSQIPKPPLQEWWTFRGHHLADVKRSFLHRPFLTVPSAYSGFQTWAVKLWWLLHDGYAAQTHYVMDCITGISNASYDMQTLGGYVSFDKFAEVFDSDVA